MDVLAALGQAPEEAARAAFIEFVRTRGDDALWKTGGPEHLTASCFVFSTDLRQVLLTHHRKGRFWVQLGGHLEVADASLADAARREGREESGIPDLELLGDQVVDRDRHELHGGFTCAAHWDVGFVALSSSSAGVEVSPESLDVRWFPVDALPPTVPTGSAGRLAAVRDRTAALLAVETHVRRQGQATSSRARLERMTVLRASPREMSQDRARSAAVGHLRSARSVPTDGGQCSEHRDEADDDQKVEPPRPAAATHPGDQRGGQPATA